MNSSDRAVEALCNNADEHIHNLRLKARAFNIEQVRIANKPAETDSLSASFKPAKNKSLSRSQCEELASRLQPPPARSSEILQATEALADAQRELERHRHEMGQQAAAASETQQQRASRRARPSRRTRLGELWEWGMQSYDAEPRLGRRIVTRAAFASRVCEARLQGLLLYTDGGLGDLAEVVEDDSYVPREAFLQLMVEAAVMLDNKPHRACVRRQRKSREIRSPARRSDEGSLPALKPASGRLPDAFRGDFKPNLSVRDDADDDGGRKGTRLPSFLGGAAVSDVMAYRALREGPHLTKREPEAAPAETSKPKSIRRSQTDEASRNAWTRGTIERRKAHNIHDAKARLGARRQESIRNLELEALEDSPGADDDDGER